MVKFGILKYLSENREGAMQEEIAKAAGLSDYAAQVLLEASLSIGTVHVDGDRYTISKAGRFLLNDEMARVNMDFIHDVCYNGLFHLEDALTKGRPKGLKVFGEWGTIYEALSELPQDVQKSWFAFDHFYSENGESRLCIMETFWNRQQFEPAAYCLTMTSLYFSSMANGNSKMYHSDDMERCVDNAGLRVEKYVDGLGLGHSIMICKKVYV